MTQRFSCTVGGVDAAASNPVCREELGMPYATLEFVTSIKPALMAHASAHIGDKTFDGYVYTVRQSGEREWSVYCRSGQCRLGEPFLPRESSEDVAETLDDLLDLYAGMSGVTIHSTLPTIRLPGGRYIRDDETPLDALTSVVSAVGGVMRPGPDDGTVEILPVSIQCDTGDVIPDDIYFDFAEEGYEFQPGLIGTVVCGYDPNDCQVSVEVMGNWVARIFAEDLASISSVTGVDNLTRGVVPVETETTLVDSDSVALPGRISRVRSVSVDGAVTQSYRIDGAALLFDQPMTAIVKVSADVEAMVGTATRYGTSYKIVVTACETPQVFVGTPGEEGGGGSGSGGGDVNDGGGDDGGCVSKLLPFASRPMLSRGFTIAVITSPGLSVESPTMISRRDGTEIGLGRFEANGSYPITEDVGVIFDPVYDEYMALASYPVSADASATDHYGRDVPCHILDGKLYLYDRRLSAVRISYTAVAQTLRVRRMTRYGEWTVRGALPCGGMYEFTAYGIDPADPCSYPAELNQSIRIDLLSATGYPADQLAGRIVHIGPPEDRDVVVDRDCMIEVYISAWGEYTIKSYDEPYINLVLEAKDPGS